MGIPNSVKFHRNNSNKSISDLTRRYVVALGGHTNQFFSPLLTLTILFNYTIQMCYRIFVYPILIDAKYIVIGGREALARELSHTC